MELTTQLMRGGCSRQEKARWGGTANRHGVGPDILSPGPTSHGAQGQAKKSLGWTFKLS